MKKGKLLLSYTTEEEIGEEKFNKIIQILKESANDYQKEYLDNLTYDKFTTKDFNLRFYKHPVMGKRGLEYDYLFLQDLDKIIFEKTEKNLWEIDTETERKIQSNQYHGRLIEHAADYRYYPKIDIYEYGKTGLEFIFKNSDGNVARTVKALPACQDYYYRDWKQGICVKSQYIFLKRSYKIAPPDLSEISSSYEDEGEGTSFYGIRDAANFIKERDAYDFNKCPPGTQYETKYKQVSEYIDEGEKTTIHVKNATPQQEIDLFKKVHITWRSLCPGI